MHHRWSLTRKTEFLPRCMGSALPGLLLLMLSLTAVAQKPSSNTPDAAMPLHIETRLWNDKPGPVQSTPDSPRLMVLYPGKAEETIDLEVMRYAGRVEPESATVSLNGEPLKVWPGGVFTGIWPLETGSQTWRFEATADGISTVVERSITRPAPAKPLPDWPPQFASRPVSPAGDYLLREGNDLKVTLRASAGHTAQMRIGDPAPWETMTEQPRAKLNGVYTATLTATASLAAEKPLSVQFRLIGASDGQEKTVLLDSKLRFATLKKQRAVRGAITDVYTAFLKDTHSWERWGNWAKGVEFPIDEIRGDRLSLATKRGETGWIETGDTRLIFPESDPAPVRLSRPAAEADGRRLTLRFEQIVAAAPCVFYHEPGEDRSRLRINFPGEVRVNPFNHKLSHRTPFVSLQSHPAGGNAPASVEIAYKGRLWGYRQTWDDETRTMTIEVRLWAEPRTQVATTEKPLAGLRIMIDPGHGAHERGAIGPSGLTESDVNLVQAAWLEKYLLEMGAEVRQTRRGDDYVSLDGRVEAAEAWDADLFLSLHHNAVGWTTDPSIRSGAGVYYHFEHSAALAQAIAEKLAPAITPDDPEAHIFKRNFRVNRNLSLCPSILTETAFICNPIEDYLLRQDETLKRTARAIAEGVAAYIQAGPPALEPSDTP